MSDTALSEFVDKIEEVMPAVMKGFSRMQANEFSKGQITLPQFLILNHLDRYGEAKMSDLAKAMNVTTAAATGMVDRLVRCGYITRTHDVRDRRVINVKLTLKGTSLVKKIASQRRHITSEVFGRISKEERDNYLSIMLHIRDLITEEKKN